MLFSKNVIGLIKKETLIFLVSASALKRTKKILKNDSEVILKNRRQNLKLIFCHVFHVTSLLFILKNLIVKQNN